MSSATLIFVLADIVQKLSHNNSTVTPIEQAATNCKQKSYTTEGTHSAMAGNINVSDDEDAKEVGSCATTAAAVDVPVPSLPAQCSPFVPALAFGPGLNVEGCLLKYVGSSATTAAGTAAVVIPLPSPTTAAL
jgi:hypothetical protein